MSDNDSFIQFKRTDHWRRVETSKETASQLDIAVTSAALPGTTTGEQSYKHATYFYKHATYLYTATHIGRYTCASSQRNTWICSTTKAYAYDEAIELESDVEQHNAAEQTSRAFPRTPSRQTNKTSLEGLFTYPVAVGALDERGRGEEPVAVV